MSTSNTSDISLIVYGSLIFVALAFAIYIYHQVKNEKIAIERVEKIIDIFKYTIVSVSIATTTLIIADLFKEREYDKNEMQAFNEYIPYIVDTASIDKKLIFCQFFVSVTPEGSLKDGWIKWQTYLQKEKIKVDQIEKEMKIYANKIYKDTTIAKVDLAEMQLLEKRRQEILSNVNAEDNFSYLVIFSADKEIDKAKYEVNWAKKNIHDNVVIFKKGQWFRTAIIAASYSEANYLAKKIKENTSRRMKMNAYVVSLQNWCSNMSISYELDCRICN